MFDYDVAIENSGMPEHERVIWASTSRTEGYLKEVDMRMRYQDLEVGSVIDVDAGFDCVRPGAHVVQKSEDGALYISCTHGKHFLDGQIGGDGYLVGIKLVHKGNFGLEVKHVPERSPYPWTVFDMHGTRRWFSFKTKTAAMEGHAMIVLAIRQSGLSVDAFYAKHKLETL